VAHDGDQHRVFEHVGMVAGMEGVAVAEHAGMVPAVGEGEGRLGATVSRAQG
jgi:hypothetical protein